MVFMEDASSSRRSERSAGFDLDLDLCALDDFCEGGGDGAEVDVDVVAPGT